MLLEKATGSNLMVHDKYITVSGCKKNIEDAHSYFNRISNDFRTILKKLGSRQTVLDATKRLHMIHDFYRV